MTSESTPPTELERYLSPAAVAGRFLTRIDNVMRWIEEGKLNVQTDHRGRLRIPESALRAFQEQAYRRESFPGIDHGLHSWQVDREETGNLPALADNAADAELNAARWPFPHA